MTDMQVSISSPCQLSADQTDRWRQLMSSHPRNFHPQLTPEWAKIAERVGRPVEVAEAVIDGNPVLFAFERQSSTRATPIGGHFTDRQAIFAPTGYSLDARELLAACRLSIFQFDHLPVGDSWIESTHYEADRAYAVSLANGFAHYWSELQRSHPRWCQQLGRKRRKLVREVGALRFELHTDCQSVLDALIQWKRSQVLAVGLKDSFSSPLSKALLVETIKEQSRDFSGWLSALFAGQQLIAVHLGQRSQHAFNAWIPAHHPQFSSYSPGALLHLELLRMCAEEGVTDIDLGRGENPLKLKLANDSALLAVGSLYHSPLRQRLAKHTEHAKNTLISVTNAREWVRFFRYFRYKRSRHDGSNGK